jgi:three-Cys-motif partner protein
MSNRPEDFLGADNLPARKSGDWAKDKLYYVQRYQTIFATGMKEWTHRTYIDLMAGPGICRIEGSTEEFPGSPLLSLAAPFTRRIFIESHPVLANALEQRTVGQLCEVWKADAASAGVIQRLRDATDGGIGLAFVDNLGLTIPFEPLAKLVTGRNIDLLITLQLVDLRRNVLAALKGGKHRPRFDAFIGTTQWVDVVGELANDNARASEMADALIALYFKQFAKVGHGHADQVNYEMRNSMGATQYRLALVSAHPLAVTYLQNIGTIDPRGQRGLLD